MLPERGCRVQFRQHTLETAFHESQRVSLPTDVHASRTDWDARDNRNRTYQDVAPSFGAPGVVQFGQSWSLNNERVQLRR